MISHEVEFFSFGDSPHQLRKQFLFTLPIYVAEDFAIKDQINTAQ